MSVLDNFVDEMMQQTMPKMALIEQMLRSLENEKLPQLKIRAQHYTFQTGLHGLRYNYQDKTVTLSYIVADSVYPDVTVSFQTFKVVLEGLGNCIRQQKW